MCEFECVRVRVKCFCVHVRTHMCTYVHGTVAGCVVYKLTTLSELNVTGLLLLLPSRCNTAIGWGLQIIVCGTHEFEVESFIAVAVVTRARYRKCEQDVCHLTFYYIAGCTPPPHTHIPYLCGLIPHPQI